MLQLNWQYCPNHRTHMQRDESKEGIKFFYCPICGFFCAENGMWSYSDKLIGSSPDHIFPPERVPQPNEPPYSPYNQQELENELRAKLRDNLPPNKHQDNSAWYRDEQNKNEKITELIIDDKIREFLHQKGGHYSKDVDNEPKKKKKKGWFW